MPSEKVVSRHDDAIKMTRRTTPHYVQKAIEESIERAKADARKQRRGFLYTLIKGRSTT
jgi:hypothetical protein